MVVRGLLGVSVLLLIGYCLSNDRKSVTFRHIGSALALQCGVGAFALMWPPGQKLFGFLARKVTDILAYGNAGTEFVFGALVGQRMQELLGGNAFVFALQVLPLIVYVSALIAVLYQLRLMQRFAEGIGWVLRFLLGTSAIESFSSVMTVMLGQSEMPVVLRPYLQSLRQNELFTIMCSGTASISGSVLAGYAGLGIPMPYLLAATFMAIPGGLLFAKLLSPDQETSRTARVPMPKAVVETIGIFDALAEGAMSGARVAFAVGAVLVAFVGVTALMDGALQGLTAALHLKAFGLSALFGFMMAPLAWTIGIPWSESSMVGTLLGQKLAFNEFVAYMHLAPLTQKSSLSAHDLAIVSIALCGFSNLSSIGILIGAYGSVAPERKHDIARMAPRCVVAGALSNLMSATLAGLFVGS